MVKRRSDPHEVEKRHIGLGLISDGEYVLGGDIFPTFDVQAKELRNLLEHTLGYSSSDVYLSMLS